jgi:hypothetical protein
MGSSAHFIIFVWKEAIGNDNDDTVLKKEATENHRNMSMIYDNMDVQS